MRVTGFMAPYNFARRLKTLSSFTPYEYIYKIYTSKLDYFILNPSHQMPGLNTCCCYIAQNVFFRGVSLCLLAVNLSFYKVSNSVFEGYSEKRSIEQQTAG